MNEKARLGKLSSGNRPFSARWIAQGVLSVGLLASLSQPAHARVDGFWVWQPDPHGIRYLLPKLNSVDPSRFASRYLKILKASPVYKKMENLDKLSLSTDSSRFSELPLSSSEHPNVAVVLNRPNQMTDQSAYLKTVVQSFEQEGPKLFSIPVGLEEALSPSDLKQFMFHLRKMDGQLGVGGDDVHPQLYGLNDTSQTLGDISLGRDRQQIAYMRDYRKHGKGRVFYICGSMQRAAVDDGHGFHPDIAHLTDHPHHGPDGPVMLEILAEPESELAQAAGSTRFQTSNYHHSAVNPARARAPGLSPSSKVTAHSVGPDGQAGPIVKAIEFPDHVGFATQFHPEFRGSPEEHRIVQYVAAGWKLRGRYSPEVILRCVAQQLSTRLGRPDSPALPGPTPP